MKWVDNTKNNRHSITVSLSLYQRTGSIGAIQNHVPVNRGESCNFFWFSIDLSLVSGNWW
jgi:hypothetical protein